MAKGAADLKAYTAKVRALADLPKTAEPALVRAADREVKRTAKSGLDPEGKPLRPRKLDGASVFKNLAQAIDVSFARGVILIEITGHVARHHLGIVKGTGTRGERARTLIPRTMTSKMARTLKRTALAEFEKAIR